ncbi:hypothetical protein BD779DRAFT_1465802 [Infundibulicybe gibba]|nr:hypothetical protein BD779DRAFT_1465802 [Infundibulicybe gibba]
MDASPPLGGNTRSGGHSEVHPLQIGFLKGRYVLIALGAKSWGSHLVSRIENTALGDTVTAVTAARWEYHVDEMHAVEVMSGATEDYIMVRKYQNTSDSKATLLGVTSSAVFTAQMHQTLYRSLVQKFDSQISISAGTLRLYNGWGRD